MALRQRVLADCDAGLKTKAVATKFKVSPAWVRRLEQHPPRAWRHHSTQRRRCSPDQDRSGQARQAVRQRPNATLLELAEMIGVRCGKSAGEEIVAHNFIDVAKCS